MKKLLAALLTLVFVLSMLPTISLAASPASYFIYGELPDGTISIVGLSEAGENQTSIEIPATINGKAVTEIAEWAFAHNENLTSVSIPDSVTSIGIAAFYGCSNLTGIEVSPENKSYCSIDGILFSKDRSELILYPAKNDNESYSIPDSVSSIEYCAFLDCSNLISVTIPDSVITMGNGVFDYCSSLTDINVSSENDTYCSIDGVLFTKDQTTLIRYPAGKNEESYSVPNCVTTLDDSAFSFSYNLTTVIIPDSVTSFGHSFEGCSSLVSINIPKNVTEIDNFAFSGCEALTSISIPDGVTKIGEFSFQCCESLDSVYIPASVTSIDVNSFYDCWNLSDVYYSGTRAQWNEIDIGIYNDSLYSATLHCDDIKFFTWEELPNGSISITGVTDEGKKQTVLELPTVIDGKPVSRIGDLAFSGCNSLTDVYYAELESQWNEIDIGTGNTPLLNAEIHCVSIFTWEELPDGTVSITGLSEAGENQTNIEIPDSIGGKAVTEIGDYAFNDYDNITSVSIPDSVTGIGDYAFAWCAGLTSINIPDSVARIGDGAFAWCYNLTDIEVSPENKSFCSIDGVLFSKDKTELILYPISSDRESYTIPNGVIKINDNAFAWCDNLTNITLPDSVTSIGDGAFSVCQNLTNISLPKSITSIGVNVFDSCYSLTDIDVSPENEAYCSIDGVLFSKDQTRLILYPEHKAQSNYTIPDGVTRIEDYAFNYCGELYSIELPASVTSIGYSAFDFSMILSDIYYSGTRAQWNEIDIGEMNNLFNTATIHYSDIKFYTWEALPDGSISITGVTDEGKKQAVLEIPTEINRKPVTSIGDDAFSGCNNLTDVYYAELESQWNELDIGTGNAPLLNATFHYAPIFIWETNWDDTMSIIGLTKIGNSQTNLVFPDSIDGKPVTGIDYNTFSSCENLLSISIPASVNWIDIWAFQYCEDLTRVEVSPENETFCSVDGVLFSKDKTELILYPAGITRESYTVPNGVTSIGDGAFENNDSLTEVILPESLTSIGYSAFSYCSSLESISIPAGVSLIDTWAFDYCRSLTSIEVAPENEAYCSIDGALFTKDLSELIKYPAGNPRESYTIPNGVNSIWTNAFYDSDSLTGISIPDSVTSIGHAAFWNCCNLTSISIPNSVTSIDNNAFVNCFSLTSVKLPDGLTSIESSLFSSCSSLTEIDIPDSVTSIGYQAFIGCKSLTEINIPDNVSLIDDLAFGYCESLTGISIPKSVTEIGESVFEDCYGLTNIEVAPENEAYCSVDGVLFTKDRTELIQYPASSARTTYSIPNNVSKIDEGAFNNCRNLTSIEVSPENEAYCSVDGVLFTKDKTELIQYPIGSTRESYVVPNGVTSISAHAFSDNTSLTGITLPESLTSIGYYAFSGCDSLTSISIPAGVPMIDGSAFLGCDSLISIEVAPENESLCSIDGVLFSKDMTELVNYPAGNTRESYTIPDGVIRIDSCAFADSVNLTSITIPDSVTEIHTAAFAGCSSLTEITFPDSVKEIGNEAFVACDALTKVVFLGDAPYVWPGRSNNGDSFDDSVTIYYNPSCAGWSTPTWQGYNAVPIVLTAASGDVNGDGKLTNADLIIMARSVVELVTLTAEQASAADANGDGKVTNADLIVFARRVVGLE